MWFMQKCQNLCVSVYTGVVSNAYRHLNCIQMSKFQTLNFNSRFWVLETWFLSLKTSKFVILLGSTMYKSSVKCNKLRKAQNSISWISFICKGAAEGPWILEMHKIHVIPGRSLDSAGFQDEQFSCWRILCLSYNR